MAGDDNPATGGFQWRVLFAPVPVSEPKYWSSFFGDVLDLADREGIQAFQVQTDMFTSINSELLEKQFGLWWFVRVANRLVLPGLCAPITTTRGIGTIFRAASTSQDFEDSSGYQIDNSQFWSNVQVLQDGYDLSRQEKLRYLCQNNNRRYLRHLKVCNGTTDPNKINCGRCEKCIRTTVGLLVEGVNPKECNLYMDETTIPYIKECFGKGKIPMNKPLRWIWQDIQSHIPVHIDTEIKGSKEFLQWLGKIDFSKYKMNRIRHYFWNLGLLFRGGRMRPFYLNRKIKCYYYIFLTRLKVI